MVHVFDGRAFAATKEVKLKEEVSLLKSGGVTPKLVSIFVGDDPASKLYLSLKRKATERIGAELEVKKFDKKIQTDRLIDLIKKLNKEKDVHGIMVQLPLPESFSESDRNKIIRAIQPEKDVDGMGDDSSFLTPLVKAVIGILKEASGYLPNKRQVKVLVVGHKGFEGGKLTKVLGEMGYRVSGLDVETKELKPKTTEADILISATGVPGLIKKDMVKEGAVVIDVGAPKGDVLFDEVVSKTSFITPVPGGIGPATIACLLENLVEAAKEIEK